MYVCALCVCLVPRSVSAHGVGKRALDQLELELQVIVPPEWVMETELRSSTRPRALNHETIYPAPKLWVDFFLSLLIFWESHTRCLSHIITLHKALWDPAPPLLIQHMSCFPLLPVVSPICETCTVLDVWPSTRAWLIYQGPHFSERLSIALAPQLGVGLCVHLSSSCCDFFSLAWYCIVLVHAAPTAVSSSYVQGSYCVQIHFLMNVIKL